MAVPETPLTRGEQYLAKAAGQETALPNVPLTRLEQYLAKIAGQDVKIPDVPLTRTEQYLAEIAKNGGGSSITVYPLTVTSNGTQTAPSGKAYSPVTVNVPNSYSGSDLTKVVKNINGVYQLTEQTSYGEATKNGRIYTTYNNSVTVNVQPTKIIDRTGKLSNIIGIGDELNAFNSALSSRKIFAFVNYEFSGTPVGMALMSASSNDIIGMAFNTDGTMANTMGVLINWNISGTVTAIALMGGQLQDLSSYAPMIDAVLRVYGTTPIGG